MGSLVIYFMEDLTRRKFIKRLGSLIGVGIATSALSNLPLTKEKENKPNKEEIEHSKIIRKMLDVAIPKRIY